MHATIEMVELDEVVGRQGAGQGQGLTGSKSLVEREEAAGLCTRLQLGLAKHASRFETNPVHAYRKR
jgi:hypothetical protein